MFERVVFMCSLVAAFPLAKAQDAPASTNSPIPEIVAIGSTDRQETIDITPGTSAAPVPDAMEILTRMPGANVNRNGALSGQAQYRGLFGPRMTVTVDGMRVTPGGPNWMDAPLHYMPAALTDRVTMTRGIAPVSAGPGIGGLIQAESRHSQFGAARAFERTGDAEFSTMSNDGSAVAAFLGISNSEHRFHVIASHEDGGAIESGDGTIAATDYGRTTYGAGYGFNWLNGELGIDLSHTDTELTGTPALPLDIDYFDTDRVNAIFRQRIGETEVAVRIFHTDVSHGMNNYRLRSAPDFSQLPLPPFQADDRRHVDVVADATGFSASASRGMRSGQFVFGLDGNFETHTAEILDPDFAPFFVENFNDSEQDQLGLFAEWFGDLGARWSMEAGARYMRVESATGAVDAFPARLADLNPAAFGPGTPPFAAKVIRDRFNAADREMTDDNVDLVLKFDRAMSDALRLGVGFARKTRTPMYVERYLWLPLEVNSGLGDLNNYVGNVDLAPEVSDQIELSLDWTFDRGFVAPRIFYRSIDDFVQGIASTDPIVIAVSRNANGDPTPLQFANVEAELYGLDVVARYRFSERMRLDATLNYVRGKRTDFDDDLYRIAPPNARVALTMEHGDWSWTAEGVFVAKQNRISTVIVRNEPRSSNAPTSGHALLNVYGLWEVRNSIHVRAGIENLLDRHYTNHLAGFNRVTESDVPFGHRLPGPGTNAFVQLRLNW